MARAVGTGLAGWHGHAGHGLGIGVWGALDSSEGSFVKHISNSKKFPGEELFGTKGPQAEFGRSMFGIGCAPTYGTESSVQASGNLSLYGYPGINHGHKRSNAIWE